MNSIWGLDSDIVGNKATLGIRTFANGASSPGGNVISGNKIHNIMTPIGDGQVGSVIAFNDLENDTANAASIGINVATDVSAAMVGNSFKNFNYLTRSSGGAVAGFGYFSGTATPTAAGSGTGFGTVGSIYLKKSGAAGETAWFLEPEGGGLWVPRNRLPTVVFGSVGTPTNGTMLYVSDGTPGSNPLAGGGGGCFAFRQAGAWIGLTLP